MSVITIRGLTGSGAYEIGREAARLIKGDYVDRQVIAQVAGLLNRPKEQVEAKEKMAPGLFDRIRNILSGSRRIESAYSRTWEEPLDDTEYISALEAVVKDLATGQNVVIVGRGSQHILRNNQSVLHVLVIAPIEDRLNRIMAELQVAREEALKYIEETDASRKAFLQRFYQKDFEDPLLYDLIVNTHFLPCDFAARLITTAANEKNPWR
jgi:cytidylate kinase